jgi:putative FmdB family regulatory protein
VPLYEYQCPTCGRFELIRKFSDEPLTVCPTCGAEVQKLLSAPAIQFKGTGWYITDYARKGSESGKPGTEGGAPAGAKADTGQSDGGGKDSAGKESGTKDTGTKDKPASSSKDAPSTGSSQTSTTSTPTSSGSSSAK